MSTTQRVVRKQLAGAEDLLQGVGIVTQTRGSGSYTIHKLDIPIPTYDIAEMQASSAEFMRLYGTDTAYTDYRRNPEGTIGIPSNLGGVWEPIRFSEYLVCGSFVTGAYVFSSDCIVALDQQSYNWQGSVPKVVAAGTTPATAGGIGAGAWVDRTDVTLRDELMSGDHPELLPYLQRTVSDRLSESVYVEDYRQLGMSDTSAFAAAISALPASGGVIKISNGRTYEVTGITNTKPYIKITGNGTIKAAASSSDTPTFYSDISGAIIELDSVTFDGNKLNQSASNKHTVHIKYASEVTINRCKSKLALRQHFFLEQCDRVVVLFSDAVDGGLSVNHGDARDIRSSGISTLRCNNVMVIGGNYKRNSYLGVRCAGYEAVFSNPMWSASESVSVGAIRLPSTRTRMYAECTTAGTTGSTEPVWAVPSVAGSTYTDGTAVWTMKDPLADNITISHVNADEQYGLFGTDVFGIGVSIATAKNVKIVGTKARKNIGNNFDTNRCWNTELIGCDGIGSLLADGFNPDYNDDLLGLGGGELKVIGGKYSDNAARGILIQQAYLGTSTPLYGDIIVDSVLLRDNGAAGLAAETCGSVTFSNNILENNGETTQIGILGSSGYPDKCIWGSLKIHNNTFKDSRTTKASYNIYFGVFDNASNPQYQKMVVDKASIQGNKFGDFAVQALFSAGSTQGGQKWFRNALIKNNTGLGVGVTNAFDAAAFGPDNFINMENIEDAIIMQSSAKSLLGMYGFSNGKIVSLFFATANTTIYDKDTGTGSAGGGNIQLTGNTTLVPAAGSIYRFMYINGAWYQL